MKAVGVLLIAGGIGLAAWMFVGSGLSREAAGLALGVLFGVLAAAPVVLVIAAGRRQAHIVYQDRIVYRVAEIVPDSTAVTVAPRRDLEVRP